MIKLLNSIIVGTSTIEPHAEHKKALLIGYYGLLGLAVCMIYFVIDLASGIHATTPAFCACVVLLFWALRLNASGNRKWARNILLPSIAFTVYLFTSSEAYATLTFLFYIPTCIGAFALFGAQEKRKVIAFAIFTFALFIASYFVDFSVLPYRHYEQSVMYFTMSLNFGLSLAASLIVVYILIEINHHQEQQILEKNSLLMKANQELDQFVYSTSHDLRAPLSSVLGLLNIARMSDDRQQVNNYLGMMDNRIGSLNAFIKDITDYSRNNRLEVRKEKIKLHPLIIEAWEELLYSPFAEGIQIELDFPVDMEIETDRNRLKIVLNNLLANAIRYHDRSKQNRFVRVNVRLTKLALYLEIEDNGQGIAKEYQLKIFDMFFRANEQSQGSGLGLYIVKETLTKLSGSIDVESNPGLGSTFMVRLPLGVLSKAA